MTAVPATAIDPEPPVRVLYVMGAGRSGSTVLDTVLGNHPQVESVGELSNLVCSGWAGLEYCACGEMGNRCPYWTQIRKEWIARTGNEDTAGYLDLQRAFEGGRWYPAELLRAPHANRLKRRFLTYAEQTAALYRAIRHVSGKPVVVDSSKLPFRALALSRVAGVDLRVIHLVRDGRGVAASLKRAYRKNEKQGIQHDIAARPAWRTAAFWTVVNLQSEWVMRSLPVGAGMRLNYEHFVTDPGEALELIGHLIGRDFTGLARQMAAGHFLQTGHTVAGNRLRMSGSIRLALDEKWKQTLTPAEKRMFGLIGGPLLRRYGYR